MTSAIGYIPYYPGLRENIAACKDYFLTHGALPKDTTCVPPPVAESWQRSCRAGLDPNENPVLQRIQTRPLHNLSPQQQILMQAAIPLLQKNFNFTINGMAVTDPQGWLLYAKETKRHSGRIIFQPGMLLTEETHGTAAQTICTRYQQPVLLLGPHNYYRIFEHDLSCATPLIDENNTLLGVLTIVKTLDEGSWGEDVLSLQQHLLGWTKSLGFAIENQIALIRHNQNQAIANGVLQTTLSAIDEGVITIDRRSTIRHINLEGAKILRCIPTEAIGRPLTDFFLDAATIENFWHGIYLQDYELDLGSLPAIQRYILDTLPIPANDDRDDVLGVILRLYPEAKANRLAARRTGIRATYTFADILGSSPAIQETLRLTKQVARSTDRILLLGESGTGKEMFAQAIHNAVSTQGPFIALNCASLPRNLIESELFGYEGGAFTGAERKGKSGKIELADGGTLFLDEIGDMPLDVQPVLLRVLEEKKVMRLGGSRYIPVDFRILAATNRNLKQMVENGLFREDLYFRLSVFRITIPPLKQRGDDILLIARHLIDKVCQRAHIDPTEISPQAEYLLLNYDWPGNVRQLENFIVYAVHMAQDTHVIEPRHLPEEFWSNLPAGPKTNPKSSEPENFKEIEKRIIVNALDKCSNNALNAAKMLGLSRSTIYRRMQEYGIRLKED